MQWRVDTADDTALMKRSEHENANKWHAALKILAQHIAQQLEERRFCVVFDRDLERCWPSGRMTRAEREREIEAFAESQGWTAVILNAGFPMSVRFQKAEAGIDAASITTSDRK
jgi:hypothetical protein